MIIVIALDDAADWLIDLIFKADKCLIAHSATYQAMVAVHSKAVSRT